MDDKSLIPIPPGHLRVTVVDHPFRRTERRIHSVPWKPGMTLSGLVDAHVPENLPVRVFLDGLEIAPCDRLSVYPMPGRHILIVPELGFDEGFKGILRIILQIALVAASFFIPNPFLAFAVMVVGGILINVLLPPQTPKTPDNALDSQAYNWAPQNTEQQGVPVPRWYGRNKLYGNVIASYIDIQGKNQILNALICLGLGPVKSLSGFRINDQAVKSFKAVTVRTRLGTLGQTAVYNFKNTKIEYPASVKVVYGTPYNYTTIGDDFDALEVDISFPEGIWHYVPGEQNLEGHWVRMQVGVRKAGTSTWHYLARQPSATVPGFNKVFVDTPRWSCGIYVDPGADPDWAGHEGTDVWYESASGSTDPDAHTEGETVWDETTSTMLHWHWIGDEGGEYIATSTDSYQLWQDYFDAYGKDENPKHWTFRYDVPEGQKGHHEVRITRVQAPATPANRYGQDLYFGGVTEVLDDKFQYPRHVLVAVRARATDQLSGSLRFSCIGEMAIVRVFDGTNWTIEYSNNPAWVAFDILTQPVIGGAGTEANPYTVVRYDGLQPERLDAQKFLEWAQHCDERVSDGTGNPFDSAVAYAVDDRVRYAGRIYKCIQATTPPSPDPTNTAYWTITGEGLEKRITFNGGFDYDTSMWEAVARVCQVGRAIPVWNGTKLTVAIDKPADPVNLYTVGNIEESKFRETFLPLEERATEIEVDFIDGETWERDKITVYRPDVGRSTGYRASIELFGITKRSEAWRAGMYRLMCNKYLIRTVEIDLDIEAINADIGDVVHIQHDVPQWGEGGRIAPELSFSSGGTYEIEVGDRIEGETSGATAYVSEVILTSGSWAAGTAAGRLVIRNQNGNFVAENLTVSTHTNVATAIASRVTVDKEVTIESGLTYKVIVRLSDDTLAERIVTNEPGTHTTLTVSIPFDTIPASFDVYAFGQVDTITRPFRVLSIKKSMEQKCTLSLIEYRPEVYQYETLAPSPTSPAQLALRRMQPRAVTLAAFDTEGPGGRLVKGIDIDYVPSGDPAFKHYEVWYRVAARKGEKSEWQFAGVAEGTSYQIVGVDRQTKYAVVLLPVDTSNRKLFIEYARTHAIYVPGVMRAADIKYSSGTGVDTLEPAEAGATLGSTIGNGSTVLGNLKKSDGTTLVTESDLFLDGLWARTITLYGASGIFRSAAIYPRFEITKDRICGYKDADTKEFEVRANDGKAYAGGGAVVLDSDGIKTLIGTSYAKQSSYKLGKNVSGAFVPYADLWGEEVGGTVTVYLENQGLNHSQHSTMKFSSTAQIAGKDAVIGMVARQNYLMNDCSLNLYANHDGTGGAYVGGFNLYLEKGLQVGTYAPDPPGPGDICVDGQIKSSHLGTAPITCQSTVMCTNLNADLLDGKEASDFFPVNGGQLTGANISRNADDTSLNVHGATGVTQGAAVTLYGRDHASYPGNMYLTFGGYASTGKFVIRNRNASEYNNVFEIDSVGNIVTSAFRIGAYANDSFLSICAGVDGLKGASLVMYGRDHASLPGEAIVTLGGYTAYGKFTIRHRLTDESVVNLFLFDKDANLRIGGTTFGTSASRVVCVGTGTAPTSSPADAFQMYSKDISAGNAAPHFLLEGGAEIRLCQQAHIADPSGGTTIDTQARTAINSILAALENLRFLAAS